MSFELPVDLESRVADYAEEAGIAPDQAVRELIEVGLGRRESPGWALIGLFSSPEDVALMEEVDQIIADGKRHEMSLPPIDLDADA